jgi:hypothetical protein
LVEIFAGGMLASFFLGEPVLSPLKSNQHLALYTAVWYDHDDLLSVTV